MPAASAASVAVELLAFHREPAIHRPRYLHGQQALPPGDIVLRFALGRFPGGWARDVARSERQEVRTAALEFVRQVCLWERATHYQLLCVPGDAQRAEIRGNYQLLIALIHPDRQEPGAPTWPAGSAQRANRAYEALADERARAEYDASLGAPGGNAAADARVRAAALGRAGRRRSRPVSGGVASLARRAAIVGGVIVTLFIVQSWWVGGLKPEYSLLEGAMSSSQRWGVGLGDAPRFLSGPAPAKVDTGLPLDPLTPPRRVASLAPLAPIQASAAAPPRAAGVAGGAAASAEPAVPPALRSASELSVPQPIPAPPAPAPARPAIAIASATAPPPAAEPPVRVAQAVTAPKAGADTPTREQVELVVALLIGYYDAGDSERLTALIDADALGWMQGLRTRNAFAEFFGATRARKLRMERLGWRNNGALAEARGEATVVAEYPDGRPRLERRVPIELDIALRNGEPRITRLVLFPNG